MKKNVLYIFFLLAAASSSNVSAQWLINPYLEYKSSTVNKHNAGIALLAEYSFPKIYTVRSGAKYAAMGAGSFFIQGDFLWNVSESKNIYLGFCNKYIYNGFFSYRMHEFNASIAGLLQTKHVDLVLGIANRVFWSMKGKEKPIVEKINFCYEIEGRIFEKEHTWNLTFLLSNMDDFYIERFQFFYFQLSGNYRINERLNVWLGGGIIPAGFFHLAADYYGWFIKSGIELRF